MEARLDKLSCVQSTHPTALTTAKRTTTLVPINKNTKHTGAHHNRPTQAKMAGLRGLARLLVYVFVAGGGGQAATTVEYPCSKARSGYSPAYPSYRYV